MLREAAKLAGTQITGIGIGSTGWVYPFTGEFGDVDFFPGWKGCNPVKDLSREFNVQAALENDGDASVLGESAGAAAPRKSRFIHVTLAPAIADHIILAVHPSHG